MKSSASPWLRGRGASLLTQAGTVGGSLLAVFVVVLLVWPQSLSLLGLGKSAIAPGDKDSPDGLASVVTLTDRHAKEAGLTLGKASREPMQEIHAVPGRVIYHASRQLDLKSPVECIVKSVLVEVGREVKAGDKLVILTSSEIGLARDQVIKSAADLKLAEREADWCREIDDNLQTLLVDLKQQPDLKTVEGEFDDKVLGDYREKVLSAYSKLVLANLTTTSTQALQERGVLATRLAQERRSIKEVQAAQFLSVCETSKFESRQQRDKAKAAAEQARRLYEISCEKLRSLLGRFADEAEPATPEAHSEFAVRAPFAGRVEERFVVEAARLTVGQPLFSLANTDVLWISAEIHERNWSALSVVEGHDLLVRSPALPGRDFSARVKFVGAKVSEETRSAPLICEFDNRERKFRPGMFVWVSVPIEEPREALAVRPIAVVRHESEAFVFRPEGKETYRRVNVTTGLETNDWVEIKSGLSAGDVVVEQGAALLKSELLLPTLEE